VDDTVTSMAAVGAFGLSVAMFFHLGSQLKWGKASVCLVSAYLVGWNVLWLPMIWFSGIVALPVIILADMLHRCSKADQWRRHRGEAGPSSQSASSGPRFVFTGAGGYLSYQMGYMHAILEDDEIGYQYMRETGVSFDGWSAGSCVASSCTTLVHGPEALRADWSLSRIFNTLCIQVYEAARDNALGPWMSMANCIHSTASHLWDLSEKYCEPAEHGRLRNIYKHLGIWIVAVHRRALWPYLSPVRLGIFHDRDDFADAVCASCYVPIGLTKWLWTSACGHALCADGAVKPPWQELLATARQGVPIVVFSLGDLDTKMVHAQAGAEGLPASMIILEGNIDISSIWQLVIKGDPDAAVGTFNQGVRDATADIVMIRRRVKTLFGKKPSVS